jgi:hypothetical protein
MNRKYLLQKGKDTVRRAEDRGGFYAEELSKTEIIAVLYRLNFLEKRNTQYLRRHPQAYLTLYDEEITSIYDLLMPAIIY